MLKEIPLSAVSRAKTGCPPRSGAPHKTAPAVSQIRNHLVHPKNHLVHPKNHLVFSEPDDFPSEPDDFLGEPDDFLFDRKKYLEFLESFLIFSENSEHHKKFGRFWRNWAIYDKKM